MLLLLSADFFQINFFQTHHSSTDDKFKKSLLASTSSYTNQESNLALAKC